jgi:hypothetical protein
MFVQYPFKKGLSPSIYRYNCFILAWGGGFGKGLWKHRRYDFSFSKRDSFYIGQKPGAAYMAKPATRRPKIAAFSSSAGQAGLIVMIPAGMPLSMVMMTAPNRRIMNQSAGQVIGNRRLNLAGSARDQFDPVRLKGGFCPFADPAADEKGDAFLFQSHRKRLMAALRRVQVFSRCHLSVFNGKEFKHFCLAKVLEHLAVFRCYCKFHFIHHAIPVAHKRLGNKDL